jgi:hypothetical protein
MQIEHITIDSTLTSSPLCQLGAIYNTDKSPYNANSELHKHPYTGIYSLLFAPYQDTKIVFVEIGIEDNASMKMWDNYFSMAEIYGFEYYPEKIKKAKKDKLKKVIYKEMDVTSMPSIKKEFKKLPKPPQIVIDDSTHQFDDQIKIIQSVLPFMPSGGILVIEDIFRDEKEERYVEALSKLEKQISYATFITAEHKLEFSLGWNNSKLLVLYKK